MDSRLLSLLGESRSLNSASTSQSLGTRSAEVPVKVRASRMKASKAAPIESFSRQKRPLSASAVRNAATDSDSRPSARPSLTAKPAKSACREFNAAGVALMSASALCRVPAACESAASRAATISAVSFRRSSVLQVGNFTEHARATYDVFATHRYEIRRRWFGWFRRCGERSFASGRCELRIRCCKSSWPA